MEDSRESGKIKLCSTKSNPQAIATELVPRIDMQDHTGLREKLVEACQEWGCFRVVNHAVPSTLMEEMKAVSRSLLDLPVEIKQKNSYSEHGRGYTPYNMASPYFDSLGIYDVTSDGAIDHFVINLVPYPIKEIISEYAQAVYGLALDLGSKLMEGLGLAMSDDIFKDWICQLRMNKYNYSPESVGFTGAVMHSDPGFLTILRDDELVNGLEAVNKFTGEFVSVDPIPGTFVVNIGDVAKAWSNGKFWNVKHRVQCYEPTVRISIALFVFAPRDANVEAPPELVDSEHPCLYSPFDFEEYRKLRLSTKSGNGEALELFLQQKLQP